MNSHNFFLAFSWFGVVILFFTGLLAFLGWSSRVIYQFFNGWKYSHCINFLLIILEIFLINEISNLMPNQKVDGLCILNLTLVPIATTIMFLIILSKWDDATEKLKILAIMMGVLHVSIMMSLASFSVPVQIKLIANMICVFLPSFSIYHITMGNQQALQRIINSKRSSG